LCLPVERLRPWSTACKGGYGADMRPAAVCILASFALALPTSGCGKSSYRGFAADAFSRECACARGSVLVTEDGEEGHFKVAGCGMEESVICTLPRGFTRCEIPGRTGVSADPKLAGTPCHRSDARGGDDR
jgi:hypothetical protein